MYLDLFCVKGDMIVADNLRLGQPSDNLTKGVTQPITGCACLGTYLSHDLPIEEPK
jgi:hypothetical protein